MPTTWTGQRTPRTWSPGCCGGCHRGCRMTSPSLPCAEPPHLDQDPAKVTLLLDVAVCLDDLLEGEGLICARLDSVLCEAPETVQACLRMCPDADHRLALQVQRPHVQLYCLRGNGARCDDDAETREDAAQLREHRRRRRVVDGDRDALSLGQLADTLGEVRAVGVEDGLQPVVLQHLALP